MARPEALVFEVPDTGGAARVTPNVLPVSAAGSRAERVAKAAAHASLRRLAPAAPTRVGAAAATVNLSMCFAR